MQRLMIAAALLLVAPGFGFGQSQPATATRASYASVSYARGMPRSAAGGSFGFTGRHYAYGNYGAYVGPARQAALPIRAAMPARAWTAPIQYNTSVPSLAGSPTPAPTSPVVPYYYGTPGYPSTFYQPTVQSYAPYATPGAGYQAGHAPVYAVEYANGMRLGQSSSGYPNDAPASLNAQLGYPSYVNNRGSFGQDLFPGLAPGQVSYGQSTQAALTPPGYYGNYIAPAGASYMQIISGTTPPGVTQPLGPPPLPLTGGTHPGGGIQ